MLAGTLALPLLSALVPAAASAAEGAAVPARDGVALSVFFGVIALALGVTWWTGKKASTTLAFYTPGRSVGPGRVGLALAGDYMSAASFLGIAGLVASEGYDGILYATGFLAGWPALMLLLAEPLRNLGKFTVADVVAYRLRRAPVRIASAVGGVATLLFYAVGQLVAAGDLVHLMTGTPYAWAELLVGGAMLLYVLVGGALATTWVQITKAVLLLAGVALLGLLVLLQVGPPLELYTRVAARYGTAALAPGALARNPLDAISLGLALGMGLLGLPHILLRFYTLTDAKAARTSALWATGLIGSFYLVIPAVGFGAAVFVPGGRAAILAVDPGGNMAAPLLALHLGGAPLLGFIAAVAFATILAVVAGLTQAAASAVSHDVYLGVLRAGRAPQESQQRVGQLAATAFSALAVGLSVLFRGQNVAFLVGLAFAIAASANFPALLLSIVWRRFSTAGAVASIATGTALSVGMIVGGEAVWVRILGHAQPLVGLANPCIVSMPAAFAAAILVSLAAPDPEAQERFDAEQLRTYLGVGGDEAGRR